METKLHSSSHLFAVLVGVEVTEDGSGEWRGKLRPIPSGEVRYFRGWAARFSLVLDVLRRYPSQPGFTDDRDRRDSSDAGEET